MHEVRQSASLAQLSRLVVEVEPPEPEVGPMLPPVPVTPPVAGAPPLPAAVPNPPAPPPGEALSGTCNPKGVREQARTIVMSMARRFILASLPQDPRERM
jgi:hypothetical protein